MTKLNLLFIIDKTQTFQIVAGLILTALENGHRCHLFCLFEKTRISNPGFELLQVHKFNSMEKILEEEKKTSGEYDEIFV